MNNLDWQEIQTKYPIGALIKGLVLRHTSFGIFLDIGYPQLLGLVEIVEFLDEQTNVVYPSINTLVDCVVLNYYKKNNQIWLSMKASKILRQTTRE